MVLCMKEVSDWYVGFMHWLWGGFAIPFVLFAFVFILSLFFITFDAEGNITDPQVDLMVRIIYGIAGLGIAWLGAQISARRQKRIYKITNKTKVLKISTSIVLIVGVLFIVPELVIPDVKSSVFDTASSVGTLIAQTIIFYFVSKREFQG